MSQFQLFVRGASAAIIWLLVGLSNAMAEDPGVRQTQTISPPAMPRHSTVTKHTNSSLGAVPQKRSALARMAIPSAAKAAKKEHRLILQVNTNDSAAMNLALNNATNVAQYYKELNENVKVEVVTFGPGLHMLRNDTSPVKARIEEMALSMPEVSFKACGNTQEKMQKAENKDIPILQQAQVVKSGVVRVMELQEQGWTYVKP